MTTFVSEDYIEVSGTNDGTGQNKQMIFHVGFNQTAAAAMVWFKAVTSNKAKTITLKGYSYSRLVGSRYEIYRDSIDTSVTLESSLIDPMRFRLTARDVLYFTATAGSGGQGDVDVVGRFSLNLYDNT